MRKIAVVTTSRADYGLLRGILRELNARRDCTLQLVVAGTHLSRVHGHTIDEILADRLPIVARLRTPSGDTGASAARAMGDALRQFGATFSRLSPDIVLVSGDRYEMLAAACAAALTRAIVAHLHGGEVTAGSLDEGWRHAITKIAHLHLATTREFADRIAAMGEPRRQIYVVGAPGVEAIRGAVYLDREVLAQEIGATLEPPVAIVTYHPVTNDPAATARELAALLAALKRAKLGTIIATWPNADPGATAISDGLKRAARRDRRMRVVRALGSQRYHSLMKIADVMIGNSSSGIIEAPSFGLPVINVGSRQEGRPRAANVIDVPGDRESLLRAIVRAGGTAFRARARRSKNPYDGGPTSARVAGILLRVRLTNELRQKRFVDGKRLVSGR
jgi:UDP-hydrolysing UDP-N-acetyl-D-glucosamine 2-epimerase